MEVSAIHRMNFIIAPNKFALTSTHRAVSAFMLPILNTEKTRNQL